MNRVILTPAQLPPTALAGLKQWLGITTTRDDTLLSGLLAGALECFEAFTGRMPIATSCEETLPVTPGWHALFTRSVQAITDVEGIAATGVRFALPAGAYTVDLDFDGTGRVRLTAPGAATRIVVRFTAGLADDWDTLPDTVRHGIIRLAAHQHREREGSGAAPIPPASVAALWRPWRHMRLA